MPKCLGFYPLQLFIHVPDVSGRENFDFKVKLIYLAVQGENLVELLIQMGPTSLCSTVTEGIHIDLVNLSLQQYHLLLENFFLLLVLIGAYFSQHIAHSNIFYSTLLFSIVYNIANL